MAGKTLQWIEDHRNHPDKDACLIWPFSTLRGYGQFGLHRKNRYAHRYMCELIHGAPPTPQHQAAHSCGRGHEGCVNPHHLSWKTRSENQLDCRQHGTQAKSRHGIFGKLDFEKAERIRGLKGIKLQREIAEEFGISESTVSDVWLGRSWTRPHKKNKWTEQDDAKLRQLVGDGKTFPEVASIMGKEEGAVHARAFRKGIWSQSGHHACKHC